MSVKRTVGLALKVIALGLVMFVVLVVVGGLTAPAATAEAAPQDAVALMLPMLLVSILDALILAFVVTQSRWRGLPLIAGLTVAFYGVQTVVGQMEALVFLTPLGERMGAGSVPVLTMPVQQIVSSFIFGAAVAVAGVPLAAWLFGKTGRDEQAAGIDLTQGMGAGQWALKLGVIVFAYELLYFGFGYYVAWKSPAVLAFYQGTDPGSFLAQMGNVVSETPALIPFQALRALLWTAFALPVVSMLKEKPWIGALGTGLMLGILAFSHTLIPNPYMPTDVRMVHFIETASSTFIFGVLLFWLLHRSHHSLADLLGMSDTHEQSVEKGPGREYA